MVKIAQIALVRPFASLLDGHTEVVQFANTGSDLFIWIGYDARYRSPLRLITDGIKFWHALAIDIAINCYCKGNEITRDTEYLRKAISDYIGQL